MVDTCRHSEQLKDEVQSLTNTSRDLRANKQKTHQTITVEL